ncbi:MAG: glycosyltransferase WbuB, partial [Planctomycetota bacterium]
LSRQWVRMGHRVTVLTGFPHHPTGVVPKRYRGYLLKFENCDGIRVIRTWLYAAPNVGVFRRSLCYLSFMISAIITGLLYIRRPDVVIATSPQLLVGVAGWLIAKVKRCPFIFEVRDLWPEGIASVGVMSEEKIVYRILRMVAHWIYHKAYRIVVVTRSFVKEIETAYGIENNKIFFVPNGVDTDLFNPPSTSQRQKARQEFGFNLGFCIVYAGTIGPSQGLDSVLKGFQAARIREASLHFFGEGAAKEELIHLATQMGTNNVFFHGFVPRRQMPKLYWAADCAVVSLQKGGVWDKVLPSKMFEIMACGCPLVGLLDGESAKVAQESGGALVIPRGDWKGFANALRRLAFDETLRRTLSRAGPCFVNQRFDRKKLARSYLKLLAECAYATR